MSIRTPFIIGVAILFAAAGQSRVIIKKAVGPGILYPADPVELRTKIEALIQNAQIPELPGAVNVCIMPTGSFEVSGAVAAHAVKALQPGAFDRVIMLAPPSFANFQGCSIPAVHYYRTPLGDVALDGRAVRDITLTTLIQRHSVVYGSRAYKNPNVNRQMFHEREYAIEVALIFLQVRLGTFKLVPIVIGGLRDKGGRIDTNLKKIMHALGTIADERTLVVVCTDFTRYGAINNYTPFVNNIVSNITKLDMEAIKKVQARDVASFRRYVKETKNLKRAAVTLELAMRIAPRNALGLMLDYEVSAAGQAAPTASVSYAAIVFFDPTRPVPQPLVDPETIDSVEVIDAEPVSPDSP